MANANQLRSVLINGYLLIGCILIFTQQMILASSTIWLACLGKAIVNNKPIWLYLILTLASSFIGFVPIAFAMMLFQEAKYGIKNNYLAKFIENHKGIATLARNQELRNEKEPWPVAESDLVIEDFLYFCYNSLTIISTLVFSILAIMYVTESVILFGYISALLLTSIILYLSKPRIAEASKRFQDASIAARKCLIQTWDNVLIGNHYNLKQWTTKYLHALHLLKNRAVTMTGMVEFFSCLPVILGFIPVAAIIIWLFYEQKANAAYLVALVATLPKQIQTIQTVHSLSYIVTTYHSIKPRLLKLHDSMHLSQLSLDEPQQRINWGLLDIASNILINANSITDFLDDLKYQSNGRITLRGPNGSGKSTLLALIKERHTNAAVYLPANHDLSFSSTGTESLSSGQKRIHELHELMSNHDTKLLLLDEWDANLDSKNILDISMLLDELAKKMCLIEVRHH